MNRKEYMNQRKIWYEAKFSADNAAMTCLPYLPDDEEFDDNCQDEFFTINFRSARCKFVSFLKWDDHGHKPKIGTGYRLPVPDKHFEEEWAQSYERSKAYAEAFAEVLRQNGIECHVESREGV